MKTLLVLAALAALSAPVLAQDWTGSGDGVSDVTARMKALKRRRATTDRPQAESAAAASLDASAYDLDAAQKAEILSKLSALMNAAERDHRLHQTSFDLKLHKILFFGDTVRVHLCASPDEQLAFESGRPRCHGNVLGVSWTDAESGAATENAPAGDPQTVSAPPAHDLFDPNVFEVDPNSKDGATLAAEVDRVIAAVRGGATIKSLDVFSSASTLRDTGQASGMSHADLSRARAEKAFAFVAKRLADARIGVDSSWNFQRSDAEGNDQVYLDFGGGQSCNGTTGPNPPANYRRTPDLDPSVAGTPAAPTDEAGRAAVRAEYNRYQSVDVSFELLEPAAPAQAAASVDARSSYEAFVDIAKPSTSGGGVGGGGPTVPFKPFGFARRFFGPRKHRGGTDCESFR